MTEDQNMNIDEIVIKDRIRKDPSAKIMDLINDIKKNGLINPITVNTDKVLLAGFRRYLACKAIGMKDIPVHMINTKDEEQDLLIEISENEAREGFSMTDRLDYARRLQRIESEKADQRKKSTLKQNTDTQNSAERSEKGETRDKVATKVGMSHDTLRKAQKIEENKDLIDAQDFADWDDGKLSTNKVYQQLKQKLSDAEDKADHMEEAYRAAMDNLDREKAKLKKEQEKPPVIQKVEVVPDDYQAVKADLKDMQKKYNDMSEKWKEEAAKNKRLIEQKNDPEEKRAELLKSNATMFCAGVSNFLEKYGGYIWIMDCLDELDERERKGYLTAVNSILSWAQQIESNLEQGGNAK